MRKADELLLPPAPGLCPACVESFDQRALVCQDSVITVYCHHNSAGGLMAINPDGLPSGQWLLINPITMAQFIETMKLTNIHFFNSLDSLIKSYPAASIH